MMKPLKSILLAVMLMAALPSTAQITNISHDKRQFDADSVIEEFDKLPFFGPFKDTYFTVGIPLNEKPNEYNSEVKFQISFRQRLTKSILPFHSHLFLSYTQKAMWNIFEESLPFHDLNFNPGIGLQKLIVHKGRAVGSVIFMLEHESNGRDGEASRSWNKVSLSGRLLVDPQFMVHAKAWIPIVDGQNNKDILKYSGIFQGGAQFLSTNGRWVADVTFVKRQGWNLNFNTTLNVGYRIRERDTQFIMLHFYDGYGENMLDYNKYHCRLRIGLLIRPSFFSEF